MNICPECGQTFPEGGFCTQDGAPLVSGGDDPLVGAMLGSYRVAHLIGIGGMGRVYKGIHPTIRSRVAVKVLSHDCADRPELVDRFFAEARAVNLIRHESIVNVLDLARLADGRPYIVMEFLDGAPLSSVIAESGPVPLGTLGRLMADVLAGLGAAHSKGVVHRDLKPDNIFLTRHGRAKILDFGIAKLASERGDGMGPTRAGSLLGTPHYMSPEQALSHPVDARADLYAMGVILYEAATGQRAVDGDSVFEVLRKQVEEEPVPPRRLAPHMPPGYERVILRALAKEPARRWQSAEELVRALAEASGALPPSAWEPLGARPRFDSVGPPTPMQTPQERSVQGSRLPILVAAGLALVGAAIAGIVLGQSAGDDAPRAEDAGAGRGPLLAAVPADASPPLEVSPDGRDAGAASSPASASPASARVGAQVAGGRAQAPRGTTGSPGKKDRIRQRAAPDDPGPARLDAGAEAPGHAAVDSVQSAETRSSRGGAREAPRTEANPRPGAWDVSGYVPKALARARRSFPDAVLSRIDAEGVFPSGKADLTLDKGFSVLYRFVSPSRAQRPKELPLGVEHKPTCMYYVLVNHESVTSYPLEGWSCSDQPAIHVPRCSAARIWRRAADRGAPTRNAIGSLSYRSSSGKVQWWFQIGKDHQYQFDDDC